MADYYVDHGAYASALGTTPTWGVPQEGDGTTKDAATAAGIAEILINAVPSASEQIVIAGATITAGATAAANVFIRGATVGETATNIVTLLNSNNATNVVSSLVAIATGYNANQLRNMVFARVKPGFPGTVQIMFRIGSAALNHAANSNVGITSSGWGTPPSITQFAGGSGGCFGVLLTQLATGVGSSIPAATYGVFQAKPHVCYGGVGNSVYSLLGTDQVHCRNNDMTIDVSGTISVGRLSGILNLVVDSNLVWTGDPSAGVLTIRLNLTSVWSYPILRMNSAVASESTSLIARTYRGLRIAFGGTITQGSLGLSVEISAQNYLYVKNVEFLDDHVSESFVNMLASLNSPSDYKVIVSTFDSCAFRHTTGRTTQSAKHLIQLGANAAGEAWVRFIGCEFYYNWTGLAAPPLGLIIPGVASGTYNIDIIGGSITGVPFPYLLVASGTWDNNMRVTISGLKGASVPASIAGLQANSGYGRVAENNRYIRLTLPNAAHEFRIENLRGVADWINIGEYPTLYGRLPNDAAWSMRLLWLGSATLLPPYFSFSAPPLVKQYRVASAPASIVLRFWCKSALMLNERNMLFALTFTDSTGDNITLTRSGADVVADGAVSWVNTDIYPASTYSARKVTFSTGVLSLKQYTEVVLNISLRGPAPSGDTEAVFIDPEFSFDA